VGRAHPGLYGIARSYEEAREALTMSGRLNVNTPVVTAHDLLLYRVLIRDQPAIVDLVQAVLSPLVQARGGARPLLETLDAYFAAGAVATDAAKRLHVSVRTVTYRLERIKALTGYDMANPDLTSDAGAIGIALLGDDNEVAYNTISGSNMCSPFYGRDGTAVEVYGGQRNRIHHNIYGLRCERLERPRNGSQLLRHRQTFRI